MAINMYYSYPKRPALCGTFKGFLQTLADLLLGFFLVLASVKYARALCY